MRRVLLAAVTAAVLVCAAPATAATHTDPTGDNCKVFNGTQTWCGFDIATAADTTDADGTVHLTVTYPAHDCTVDGVSSVILTPRFELYDGTATAPSVQGSHLIGILQAGLHGYQFQQVAGNVLTDVPTTISGTAPTTFDAALPPALASTLGSFTWLASNGCIGELPMQASDIAPNSGLYSAGSGGAGALTKAAAAAAIGKALAGVKATKVATLLSKGGFPITFKAPSAGTLRVTVGRIKLIRAAGSVRLVQTTTLAKLSVTVTKAGTVKKTVRLTRAGKSLLKGARKSNTLRMTVSFKGGAVSVSKSKSVKVAPRRH